MKIFKDPYWTPAQIGAIQRRSQFTIRLIRVVRLLKVLVYLPFQVPLIALDVLSGTEKYGRHSWPFIMRLLITIVGNVLWATNNAPRPMEDVSSWEARCEIPKLKKDCRAKLVVVGAKNSADGLIKGDLIHQKVLPQDVPCFWQWLQDMPDPNKDLSSVEQQKVILYFVGGGMIQGHPCSPAGSWEVMKVSPIPVFGVNFRKCTVPATSFPAAIQDGVAAFYYLLKQGFQAQNITFMGDSGGGGIAVTLILYLLKEKLKVPGGAILISPWVDLVDTFTGNQELLSRDVLEPGMLSIASHQYVQNRPELKGTLLSPSFNKLPEGYSFEGFPRTHLSYGDAEVFLPSNRQFEGALEKKGVQVHTFVGADETHIFPFYIYDRSPGGYFDDLRKWLKI